MAPQEQIQNPDFVVKVFNPSQTSATVRVVGGIAIGVNGGCSGWGTNRAALRVGFAVSRVRM